MALCGLSLSVHFGCYNRIHRLGDLYNKHVFLTVLEAGKSTIKQEFTSWFMNSCLLILSLRQKNVRYIGVGPWGEEVKSGTQLGGVTKAPQPGGEGQGT